MQEAGDKETSEIFSRCDFFIENSYLTAEIALPLTDLTKKGSTNRVP